MVLQLVRVAAGERQGHNDVMLLCACCFLLSASPSAFRATSLLRLHRLLLL